MGGPVHVQVDWMCAGGWAVAVVSGCMRMLRHIVFLGTVGPGHAMRACFGVRWAGLPHRQDGGDLEILVLKVLHLIADDTA